MDYLEDLLNKGLAEVQSIDGTIFETTSLIKEAKKRDRYYRFFCAMARHEYQLEWEYLAGIYRN